MDERFELWAIEDGLEFWRCPEGLLTSINEQRGALLAAVKEFPQHAELADDAEDWEYTLTDCLWMERIEAWHNGQRQAALALVEGDEQCQNA